MRICALLASVLALLLAFAAPLAGQQACPGAGDEAAEAGWAAFQEDRIGEAESRFEEALERCPGHEHSRVGLGYVHLRRDRPGLARVLFQGVVEESPDHVDALVGLGILAWRDGSLDRVDRIFERVQELVPGHATARQYLHRVEEARIAEEEREEAALAWERGEHQRAARLYSARVAADSADTPALQRLGLLRAWAGRYDEALDLLERLLLLEPENLDARIDRARVLAWSGRDRQALALLDEVLVQDPAHPRALEAWAQIQARTGRYEASLTAFEELLAVSPDETGARGTRAGLLVRTGRYDEARSAYETLLEQDPGNRDARLGLGRVLAFSERFDTAATVYRGLLAEAPGDREARRGLARTLTWAGRLVEGERLWRELVEEDPRDVEARAGLAQNLRWQGRNAAALEELMGAREAERMSPDLQEQLRWARAVVGSRVRPSYVVERDSDGNRMRSTVLMAGWNPLPRLELRLDAYRRTLDGIGLFGDGLHRTVQGATLTGSYQIEPGWTVSAGIGANEGDGSRVETLPVLRVSARTPPRYPLEGRVTFSRAPLDATALLVDRGVEVRDLSGGLSWQPAPGWSVRAEGGWARFVGRDRNTRTSYSGALTRSLTGEWTVGVAARSFSFQRDRTEVSDGYFNPDFYGLGEVTARWLREMGRWNLLVEAAPGLQRVGADGEVSGAARLSTRLAYRLDPGQELSLSAGFASTGLQEFATGEEDYRYSAFILGGSWVF